MVWWDYDILSRLPDLFAQVSEFVGPQPTPGRTNMGLPFYEGGFNAQGVAIDHLKGLRTANRNRTKPKSFVSSTRGSRRPM